MEVGGGRGDRGSVCEGEGGVLMSTVGLMVVVGVWFLVEPEAGRERVGTGDWVGRWPGYRDVTAPSITLVTICVGIYGSQGP